MHLAVLRDLVSVIGNSIEVEIHADYIKEGRNGRTLNSQIGNNTLVHRFYGAVSIDDLLYKVKSTILETRGYSRAEPHDYKVTKVDVILNGGSSTSNAPRTSTIAAAKLLKNLEYPKKNWKRKRRPSRADASKMIITRKIEIYDILYKPFNTDFMRLSLPAS